MHWRKWTKTTRKKVLNSSATLDDAGVSSTSEEVTAKREQCATMSSAVVEGEFSLDATSQHVLFQLSPKEVFASVIQVHRLPTEVKVSRQCHLIGSRTSATLDGRNRKMINCRVLAKERQMRRVLEHGGFLHSLT